MVMKMNRIQSILFCYQRHFSHHIFRGKQEIMMTPENGTMFKLHKFLA